MKVKYSYKISTEPGEDLIYRRARYENGVNYQVWVFSRREWITHEDAVAAFMGYGPADSITESEAMKIIEGRR